MFLYLIICSFVSPRFLHLSSSWISDGVNLGYQFRLVDSGLEVGVEIFIFYFINSNIVNCSSILLMSISYIHSLSRPHFMRLRLRLGQFEFLIFKCVNSTVRSISNEKVDKKWSLWDPCAVHKCTVYRRTGQPLRLKKKKNWGNADAALISAIQTSTYLKIKLEYFLEKNCRLWELTRGVYNRRR